MPKVKISRTTLPDPSVSEVEIYPDGDKGKPRIGVMKFDKGKSNLILDDGILPYQSF